MRRIAIDRATSVRPWAGKLVLLASLLAGAGCANGGGERPSGTLEATEIDLAPATSGRALEVRPALGTRVAAGDTLVVLDTELIALQRRAGVAQRASLAAQADAARELLRQARRTLELAETTLARVRTLHAQGSATQQQLDDAAAQRDIAASQVAAARSRVEVARAEMARVEATIAVYDRQLADGVLTSPQSGTVLVRALEPGEMAGPARPALRIADLSRLELRIYLEAENLDRIRLGQTVPVWVDALAGELEEPLEARVSWISEEAEFTPKNAQTRDVRAQLVYAVKLALPNPKGRLHIGMTAEAEI